MKKEQLIHAYDSIQPDDDTFRSILERVQTQSKNRTSRLPKRGVLLLAACIVLILAFSIVSSAVYQKWSLPKPLTYQPNPETGIYKVHESTVYPALPSEVQDSETSDAQEDAALPLSDTVFLSEAVRLLALVGLEDVSTDSATVTRQENQYWAREEVEILFPEDPNHTRVKFDAKNGTLLSFSGIDWLIDGAAACETRQEAEALAARYYEMLPVPQGYVITGCTEYDEQYWSFDFCREVADGLYSAYEMVRIGINPVSGRLTGCNIFSVPLLDDHEPGDIPLTQAEAEQAALACKNVTLDAYTLCTAEVEVVFPNWFFTDEMPTEGAARASRVTRLGWVLTYENEDSFFADIVRIDVDYYTGEILGGDRT